MLRGAIIVLALMPGARVIAWDAPGWSHRAVVRVEGDGPSDVDVAAVRIHHGAIPRPDARDYRIFDAEGRPLPYEISFHDPRRDSLISFRCDDPTGRFFIYFGREDAPADPLRAVTSTEPGGGPPRPGPDAERWVPKAGLVLTTMRRPIDAPNPETVDQMKLLIAQSPGFDGAGYTHNIRHAVNPYGDSDHFISVYRGWIDLPEPGRYLFCTASNEASFSFLNGKPLVHWPGRHTEKRGRFGQKNVTVQLPAGRHYIEYYHEEVLLYQVAFLGYQPPGGPHPTGIPNERFPQPYAAWVGRYESAEHGRTVMLRPQLLDSAWPRTRHEGQYTRYRFTAAPGPDDVGPDRWQVQWSFGDGLTATGPDVEHVYLTAGEYDVSMQARSPDGRTIERHWPLVVFAIEHLVEPFVGADIETYAPLVADYEHDHLSTPQLAALAHLLNEAADAHAARAAASALLQRPGDDATHLADAHWILARAGAAANQPVNDEMRKHLNAALEHEADPTRRMRIIARLIDVLGKGRDDIEAAERLFAQARDLVNETRLTGRFKSTFRAACIAIGDVRLLAGRIDAAGKAYRLAESLSDPPVPLAVRKSRIGGYHEAVAQHLLEHRYDQADQLLDEWHSDFPTDLLGGGWCYWLGRLRLAQDEPAAAARWLKLAVELGRGSEFEAESRWLLAESYRATGESDKADAALRALVESGLAGPYRKRAVEALGP